VVPVVSLDAPARFLIRSTNAARDAAFEHQNDDAGMSCDESGHSGEISSVRWPATIGKTGDVMDAGRIRLLWSAGYHDAPISGLAAVDGKEMWFDTPFDEEADEYAGPTVRECFLYELSDAELTDTLKHHELFERYVSTRGCFHLSDSQRVLRDQSTHHLFYDGPHPPMPDVRGRPSVGSFWLKDVWLQRQHGGALDHAR
jgi:hypothetical protein